MIAIDELKRLFSYDPDTGLFVRRVATCNSVKIGDIAGTIKGDAGYVVISINHRFYRAHRLAWFYMYGEWPKEQIDHINHIRHDNRIENLRSVRQIENYRNNSQSKNNTSGFVGVTWDKRDKKWKAQIMVNRKCKCLGYFDKKEDAAKARKKAGLKYGFHANHGKVL